ncbi:MAG: M48 family metalloprotease [Phycisphaerales bacterium]|nr:M48 family metalloprotease [Phycisphaerales bacterium]
MKTTARSALAPAALLAALALSACQTNPATGRSQLFAISRSQEIEMGTSAMPSMISENGGKVNSAAAQAYVAGIGRSLAAQTEADNPGLPWEFTLLDTPEVNAFAMPGGKVFVARGLAEKLTNEAQLAGVLGHEIGHVTARHISSQIAKQTGVQVGAAILGAGVAAVAGQKNQTTAAAAGTLITVGGQLVTLRFSRDQEAEADHLGLRYMAKLNYDPAAMDQVMVVLEQEMGSGRQPELLSTHPDPANRRKNIAQELRTAYKGTQNNPQYVLKEQEYRAGLLNVLRGLPAPRGGQQRGDAGETGLGADRAFALGRPETWCAHCAPEAGARVDAAR